MLTGSTGGGNGGGGTTPGECRPLSSELVLSMREQSRFFSLHRLHPSSVILSHLVLQDKHRRHALVARRRFGAGGEVDIFEFLLELDGGASSLLNLRLYRH